MNDVVTIHDKGHSYKIHNPGGHIGEPIGKKRPYEHKMLSYIAGLGLKGSAVDVGAHVGNHALYFAAVCRLKVFAFEPHKGSYDALVANVELNPSLEIVASPLALGRGTATMAWNPDKKMSLIEGDGDVDTIAFDDLVVPVDLSLVKIDVEGMEPDVLAGMQEAIKAYRPVIFTEVHTAESVRAQEAVLEPLGYRVANYIHMGSRMCRWRER